MNNLSRREKEKQAREAEIIAAAEKIFSRKGFEDASMDEVAKEAQFTKRTVYQYFVNKEDLFFAVSLKKFSQLLSYLGTAVEKGKTGFEKIRLFGLAYYQFYKDYHDTFRLLYTGSIPPNGEICTHRRKMMDLKYYAMQELTKVIEEGKMDGSIRAELDAKKTAYSIILILSGFFNMLSESGNSFAKNYELDPEDFILFSLDLLCEAIRVRK